MAGGGGCEVGGGEGEMGDPNGGRERDGGCAGSGMEARAEVSEGGGKVGGGREEMTGGGREVAEVERRGYDGRRWLEEADGRWWRWRGDGGRRWMGGGRRLMEIGDPNGGTEVGGGSAADYCSVSFAPERTNSAKEQFVW
ncbi:hypothetical protein CBR_g34936 [Chara braunii]|uniref:Uncharacterized protein n=1 Tax=Chara braunii TaxID=69332 RepID=A0A388LJQ0_CHABU|nr:hypothetical protein CBR_g34936 [Chara braunii]|eukprot:GBG82560.1 hypothetical protein CBR_g34936 [Chara braunii]